MRERYTNLLFLMELLMRLVEVWLLIGHLSVSWSVVPDQWKTSVITPVAKIPRPTICADYRPISVTPILSRVLEKLVVRKFLYPIFDHPTFAPSFSDQFAFRPTGSTTCALINLNHILADLLQSPNSPLRSPHCFGLLQSIWYHSSLNLAWQVPSFPSPGFSV